MADARDAAERVARTAYGRLVALLAARERDIAAAEDALADAFAAALAGWPRTGVPDRPEAWLLVAARRALGHRRRHGAVRDAGTATLALLAEEVEARTMDVGDFPDDRLKLMFVCAHPAIDAGARTPLMLQCVLGLDAARIAAAFLVAPAAMGQRLVRAKAKVKASGIRFHVPEGEALPARLGHVLDAIYAAYGTGWDETGGGELTGEAIWLARTLDTLMPGNAEVEGLLALVLLCEARRGARRDEDGGYVPLGDQDPDRWDPALLVEGEALLRAAAARGAPGRYQAEAAIQSLQIAIRLGRGDPRMLVRLYDHRLALGPSIGAAVARAAAVAACEGAAAGLAALDTVAGLPADYQPGWAVRAALLATTGDRAGADAAYARAIALTPDPAVAAWLAAQAKA